MQFKNFQIGLDQPFFLIAGPCVIESRELAFETAGRLQEIARALGIPFIYKSSFDKANRSSGSSFRGPGIDEGLKIMRLTKLALHNSSHFIFFNSFFSQIFIIIT